MPTLVNNEEWSFLVGVITAPHGLQGEVRVHVLNGAPERMEKLKTIGLRRAGVVQLRKVLRARVTGKRVTMALEGVSSCEEAELLRDVELVLPLDQAVKPGEDEYLHSQLIGLEVVTTDGEALGPITAIWETPANDVYETPLALIPAVKVFVLEVDLTGGKMTVQYIPGMKKSDPGT
ncbi:MAG: ribosome maturation factor RimM [bacterium]